MAPGEGATTEETKMLEPAIEPAAGAAVVTPKAAQAKAAVATRKAAGPVSAADETPKAEEAKTTGPGAAADVTPRAEEDPATAAVAAAVGTSKAEEATATKEGEPEASGLPQPCRLGAAWAEVLGMAPAPGLPQASPVTEALGLPQAPAGAEAVAAVKPGGIESFRFAGKQGWVAKWGV